MEFDFLGDRCSLSECRRHDYLPFTCEHCNSTFCSEHKDRVTHRCPSTQVPKEPVPCHGCGEVIAWLPKTASASERAAERRKHTPSCSRSRADAPTCAVPFCKVRLAAPVPCTRCMLNYCVKHREGRKHDCAFLDVDVEPAFKITRPRRVSGPSETARAQAGYENTPVKPRGDARVDGSDRVYVEVTFGDADGLGGRKRIYYFFSKRWTVGRMLDAIAADVKIPTRTKDGRRLRLRVGDNVYAILDRLGENVPQHSVVVVEYEPSVAVRSANMSSEIESSMLCIDLNRTC